MCGIVGRINAAAQRPVDVDELRAATALLVHRGPDGGGIFARRNVGLGHRRLSIVDIAGGAQPMSHPDGSITVVLNGEIYNHAELRAELVAKGADFRTRSDTEVLVHGYAAWGDALLERLRGMFAFALWDARRDRLLVARDRLGIKPLYWTERAGDVLFASEVKALFAFSDVPRALDEGHVAPYLALRYVPAADTLFEGIRRLEPAHLMVVEKGRVRVSRYWDLPVRESGAWRRVNAAEEAERLADLLRETTRMHLMGEVPVGLFLSGGIDSTAIGWAMKAAGQKELKTFSVGFEGDGEESELAWARLAAKALGSEHREVRLTALDFRDALPDLVFHLDEPNADGACIPLMHLSRRAREEVTVVLSGEGADELYGGYGIYGRQIALDRARALGGRLVSAAAGASLRVLQAAKLRKYVSMLRQPVERRYLGVGRAFSDELLVEAFGPAALDALVARFAPLWDRTRGADPLERMLYNDARIWLPDELLIKADKMSMSSAIELRVPFLDHVVVEHAWGLPPSLKRRGGVGKVLLRRAMAGRIPDEILRRPKRGFPVPIGQWLRTSLHAPCRDRLLASDSSVRSLLGPRLLQRLLDEHRSGAADRTDELYALWVLEEWHRAWLSPRVGRTARNVMKHAQGATLWDAPGAQDAEGSAAARAELRP